MSMILKVRADGSTYETPQRQHNILISKLFYGVIIVIFPQQIRTKGASRFIHSSSYLVGDSGQDTFLAALIADEGGSGLL
jgi:hypothetical protein